VRLSARQRAILGQISDGAYVEVKDLAGRLDVDVSTIRRDLQTLVRHDLVLRLHGGVRLRTPDDGSPIPPALTLPTTTEDGRHRAIASTARRMVRDGDSIVLSAGPCTDALLPLLLDVEDLTVITHNLAIAQRFAQQPQTRVLVAGGEIKSGDVSITSGPECAEYLEAQRARWVFLEVDGLHPYAGVTTSAPWRVSAHRAMLTAAERRCLLAPSPVFGARCAGFIADVDHADLIITDEGLADGDLPAFAGRVVRGVIDPVDDWHH
jgi:DeoR/GlpR family transcriptional regulator of sugar metabolism